MRFSFLIFLSVVSGPLWSSEMLRVGMLNSTASRDGPGVFISDFEKNDPDILTEIMAIKSVQLDIVLITDFDQDDERWAAAILSEALEYPYFYQGPTPRGIQSGYDLNQDNRFDAEDAWGYGEFRGQHGMVILSKRPITNARSFNDTKWKDVKGAIRPKDYYRDDVWAQYPLASSGIWQVEIQGIQLLSVYATTPAFDGVEDRNGLRNMAENLWLDHYLRGEQMIDDQGIASSLDQHKFIAMGTLNLDPNSGEGRKGVMQHLLTNPRLQDEPPIGPLGSATADWRDKGIGALRVDYILPSCHFTINNKGMKAIDGNPHFLVWYEVETGATCD